jgi:SAM-dependent methyltransferase
MDRKILHQPMYSPVFLYLRETGRHLRSVIQAISSAEKTVVDLGCLDKPYEPLFQRRYKTYVGIDWVNDSSGAADIVADAHDLPLRNGSVDILLCTETLEHLEEPPRVANEIHRVLKPQGFAVLTVVLLFPKHSEADFYRWTDLGIKKLFKEFAPLECRPIGNSVTCLITLFTSFLVSALPEKLNHRHREILRKYPLWFLPKLLWDFFLTVMNSLGYLASRLICDTGLISSYLVVVQKP